MYEGENIIDSSGVVQPETQDQQPLPKYTPEGRLYEYTLRETGITGTGGASLVDDGSTDTDIPLFEMRQPSNTFQAENVYNSPTGSLSVKKILELPTDEEGDPIAYPAVRFHLYRTYTKNSGRTSEQELVQTITWSSQEVLEACTRELLAWLSAITWQGLAIRPSCSVGGCAVRLLQLLLPAGQLQAQTLLDVFQPGQAFVQLVQVGSGVGQLALQLLQPLTGSRLIL